MAREIFGERRPLDGAHSIHFVACRIRRGREDVERHALARSADEEFMDRREERERHDITRCDLVS